MKNKSHILLFLLYFSCFVSAQNNTFSPYSRYGLGEASPTTFAHNAGMGGAFIAYKPDSTMPIFINTGNPASYPLIKLTTLEVGGIYNYSNFNSNTGGLKKWSTNFAYGALGFPVRKRGGACFGIMPYTNVGYDLQSTSTDPVIGDITYNYDGTGGFNKAFLGYGVMPFSERLIKFRKKYLFIPDSNKHLGKFMYKTRETFSKLLSDFSVGFNANYLFGTVSQTARVVYPNSLTYNNTYRERIVSLSDFTGNFGIQTALTIDSVRNTNKQHAGRRRALKEKVKITFGAFMTLNNPLNAKYSAAGYNYILNGFGQESIRDTIFYKPTQSNTIRLPLEQGVGIGFKKGERINIVSDFAITGWKNFKYLDNINNYRNNYRMAIGVNYVPEKYAAGNNAFVKRINYRLGFNYNTGYIQLNNQEFASSYAVTAGVGLPVGIGRLSSMVNLSLQYGKMGPADNNAVKENFWRINFGFTFCDRWFQKFRYD